jgi:copper resistance protein B
MTTSLKAARAAGLVVMLAIATAARAQPPEGVEASAVQTPSPSEHRHSSDEQPPDQRTSQSGEDRDQHAQQHQHEHEQPADGLPLFIPAITDDDRRAAFPDVGTHGVHDRSLNYLVLFERLEGHAIDGGSGFDVDAKGWIGSDRNRVIFRAEADRDIDTFGQAHAHVMYGRLFARWWDLVAGVRQDVQPGAPQAWAAFGVQGLAPYWFEVEATAYVGAEGRTEARVKVEYELLLTNRMVLQPHFEAALFGKSDPERGVGSGLSQTELGARLRYEVRREIAPYVGITWTRKWGETGDLAPSTREGREGLRLGAGLRVWF